MYKMYFNKSSIHSATHSFHKGASFFKNASTLSKHIAHHPVMRLLPHDVQNGMHKTAEHIETVSNGLERAKHFIKPIHEHTLNFH